MFKFVFHVRARPETSIPDEGYRHGYVVCLIDFKSHFGSELLARAWVQDSGFSILEDEGCWIVTDDEVESEEDPHWQKYFAEAKEDGMCMAVFQYPDDDFATEMD